MEPAEIGLPTLHTRVERWECDHNEHWNVRFYGRSFQMAAEVIAGQQSGFSLGADIVRSRHSRFHRELWAAAPVEVRSATLVDAGPLDGIAVHLLISSGQLAATALDWPGDAGHLPQVSARQVPLALPRGIDISDAIPAPGRARIVDVQLGPTRPEDFDHAGNLRFEQIVRHSSTILHTQFNSLGFTSDYADRTRLSRMGVEQRVVRGLTPPVGGLLYGTAWISKVAGKSIWCISRLFTAAGQVVAEVEMCLLMVNLETRKAVPAPEFVQKAADTVVS